MMGFIYCNKNSHFGKQLQAKSVRYISCSAGMITSSVTMSTSHDRSQFIIFIATRSCWPVVAIILSLNRCGIAPVTCHTSAIIMLFRLHIIEMIWKYIYIWSWWSLPLSVAKKLDTRSLLLQPFHIMVPTNCQHNTSFFCESDKIPFLFLVITQFSLLALYEKQAYHWRFMLS